MNSIRPVMIPAILAVVLGAGSAAAVTIHVPADHATIAGALGAAESGDVVAVAPGIYQENGLLLVSGVHLEGAGSTPGDVIIQGAAENRVLTVAGGDSRVENLRIESGLAVRGGGILVESGSPALRDLEVSGCVAERGAGIAVIGGAPTLERCFVVGNLASSLGGGLYLVDAPGTTLVDCLLAANEAHDAGGGWYVARSSLSLTGCTVVDNRAPLGAEGVSFGGDAVMADRTIAAGNHPAEGWSESDLELTLISDHAGRVQNVCSLRHEPGWLGHLGEQLEHPTAHNLADDPLFCRDEGYPQTVYGLAANSLCLAVNNPDCDQIGAFGQACGPVGVPGTPSASCLLHQPYPNPFNPVTHVRFEIARDGPVELVVYGLDGRRVATLVHEQRPAGSHVVTWNGRDDHGRTLASGVYVCRLRADGLSAATRLTLVK